MKRRGFHAERAIVAVTAALVLASAGFAEEQAPPREPTIEPIPVDLTERTERSLLLLDVEAVDKQGRPLLGLKKEELKIRVNYVWRKIYSLDDLKSRLAKVVMMILVVRYFEYALGMDFTSSMDLLQFAGGIALLGLALYFAHLADKGRD